MAAALVVEQPGPQDQRIYITVMAQAILQLLTLLGIGSTWEAIARHSFVQRR
jgi:hypothetical protein